MKTIPKIPNELKKSKKPIFSLLYFFCGKMCLHDGQVDVYV